MPNIKLQSSDGEVFEVDVDIAKCSVTIKTMLEDLGMDEDEEEVVPLPNVNSAILRKVIQWATYHKDDPPPPEDDENKEKRTDDISSWDADFLKTKDCTLIEHWALTNRCRTWTATPRLGFNLIELSLLEFDDDPVAYNHDYTD
ncbi:hypothetical protein TSAR_014798 [Trichomalopsis sarcophagae]|uniref:SKP1 component POZ domain-containing protein n=1 Tax=Trichomalopsis sarcophagae TaxID=543379 RepID=A0A232ESQ3_9HYME|nr:hypothetical protein TSAR_014798 [Trichomalopsis sarcophagae]